MLTQRMYRLAICLAAVLAFLVQLAHAQDEPFLEPDYISTAAPKGAHVRLNVLMGQPMGAFADHVGNPGIGLGGSLALRVPNTPLHVGLDLGFLIYGYERRSEPFSSTIPDVFVEVETHNNIGMGHLLVRLQPPSGRVRPFVDGLFGTKYLYTSTQIKSERDFEDEPIAESTNFDDWALSYGGGIGADVTLTEGISDEGDWYGIYLTGGVQYLLGGEAEYLKEGSIRRSNGAVTYDVERSRTGLVLPQLGITMRF